ncbi:F-box protein [Glycine soja]|uniref:F-box protein n=1 Tax=Glycine soja TaxID=3848 RepID=A0A0B2QM66_GLYSO|nr:F-box protein [Glycine soja]
MRSFRMRNLLSSVKKKTIENRNKTSRNCISITKELARLVEEEEEEEVNEEGFNIKSSAPSRTHGVQPLGNLYLNTGSTNSRDTGLGNLHTLSDDLVLDILGFLDASSLGILATVSKSFYVFTNHEPVEEFVLNFEEPNKPVLLEGCIDNWGALRNWDRDYLVRLCGDVKFSVGSLEMKLGEYFGYSGQVREERPLYLFDPKFAEKVSKLGDDYDVPVYFREDLLGVLGNERPDYRWVIIGPSGSGSSFHVDPNSASAWNAVIKGSKKWILFPPDVIPPGVHPSPDGADAASPVSIIEWFMNFYGATKNWQKKPIECVCKAGEVIFVPCGWWHLVINLEESIAITQNYVSKRNLMNVLDFLKRPNATLVSGTRDRVNLYDKFKNAIEASFPGEIDELTRKEEERKIQQRKLSFWDTDADTYSGAFKFSF